MLALTNSWISPVGSTTSGHEGEKIRWKRVSHSVLSVRMPEWQCGSNIWRRPYSFKIDLNILFCTLGTGLPLSINHSLLHEIPSRSEISRAMSLLIIILSSEEKCPRKQIEAARRMQSPYKFLILALILSNLCLTFWPYSRTLSNICWVRMCDISATSIFLLNLLSFYFTRLIFSSSVWSSFYFSLIYYSE